MKHIIQSALIEILSGIAKYHKDGGVISRDKHNRPISILFSDKDSSKVIIREYHENGNLWWKKEYHQGQLHGTSKRWYKNGKLRWEENSHQGQLHGISKGWHENGKLRWENNYHHGKRIKL